MQQLTIEGKILIFQTSAISKVVHLALVKDVPSSTILQFLFGKIEILNSKILLFNEHEQEGLKNVDIFSKITSLQRSWV